MHSTLFHIPPEVGGYPLFGFGLLLAVWAALSVGFLVWLGLRQGWTGDTLSYVPLLLLVGAAIAFLLPALSEEEGLPIRSYGLMMLLGVTAGVTLAAWRAQRAGIHPDVIFNLAFWMFIPGIVGARLFFVIEYWDTFLRPVPGAPELGPTLRAIVNVAQGGLVVYGSVVGGMLGLVIFVRLNRLPLLAMADLITPSMVLGLALGRIGCLLNGCCYGGLCDLPWAVTFPAGSPPYESQVDRGYFYGFQLNGNPESEPVVLAVLHGSAAHEAGLRQGDRIEEINGFEVDSSGDAQAVVAASFENEAPLLVEVADRGLVEIAAVEIPPRSLRVHPAQLYSAIHALLLCLFLLAYDPYCRRDGQLFATLLTIYPISRFLLEIIRTDEAAMWSTGLSISQNVSILLLAGIAILWVYVLSRPPRRMLYARG